MNIIQSESISKPSIREILAIERYVKGERKELFQEAVDVLRDERHAKSDPITAWRIENLKNLVAGFNRVNRETSRPDTRPQGVLSIRLVKHAAIESEIERCIFAFTHKRREGLKVLGLDFLSKPVEYCDLGTVSVNVVTDTGVGFVIDAIQALATISNLKFHGSGTTNTAENQTQTALIAEVGSRSTGTQTEGASANIYKSVGTNTYASSFNIVEHGIFTASSGGVMFDRSIFTAIPVDTSTSIEFSYSWTLNAGG